MTCGGQAHASFTLLWSILYWKCSRPGTDHFIDSLIKLLRRRAQDTQLSIWRTLRCCVCPDLLVKYCNTQFISMLPLVVVSPTTLSLCPIIRTPKYSEVMAENWMGRIGTDHHQKFRELELAPPVGGWVMDVERARWTTS